MKTFHQIIKTWVIALMLVASGNARSAAISSGSSSMVVETETPTDAKPTSLPRGYILCTRECEATRDRVCNAIRDQIKYLCPSDRFADEICMAKLRELDVCLDQYKNCVRACQWKFDIPVPEPKPPVLNPYPLPP